MLSLSSSAQDGAGARRRSRLLNAATAGAAGARRLAAAFPGPLAGSERAAAYFGAGREGVHASSEDVAATGAGFREAVIPAIRSASWEAIPVSEAGSNAAASTPRGTDAEAVASACLASSCRAAAGSAAEAVATTCRACSACATAGSDAAAAAALVVAGAKAVTFTYHTGPATANGSETVSITGFTTATGYAAAFGELHAVDVLDIGPALAQLLRAVLPGRGAGGEGCGQVGLLTGPFYPRQASQAGLP